MANIMSQTPSIYQCLLPVAGYGTRFLPATLAMPKEMLPIVNKPLIQYAVEEAMEAGINRMTFVTGKTKQAIADHFDSHYELEQKIKNTEREKSLSSIRDILHRCDLTFIRQYHRGGLGHAILMGENILNNQPFAVALADDLCVQNSINNQRVLAQLSQLYEHYQCTIIAVKEVQIEETSKYGIISGHEIADGIYQVDDMVEKPKIGRAPTNIAVIGRYILTPDIFTYLKKIKLGAGGELQLTDALKLLAKEKQLLAVKIKGEHFDCGSIKGFVEATNYCYHHHYKNI